MAEPQNPPPPDLPGIQNSIEDWRRLVAKGLKGRDFSSLQHRTRDGIVVEPLYAACRDRSPLPGRGTSRWTVTQLVDDPDPQGANEQALADLQGGATALQLRFAGSGLAQNRGLPARQDALLAALEDIDLGKVRIWVDPHPHGPEIASWLADHVTGAGLAPELAQITFGLDPLAAIASEMPGDGASSSFAAGFESLRGLGFRGPLAVLDGRPCHEAGGMEAQELAWIAASAVWWLRALQPSGSPPAELLPLFGAAMAVDRDQFLSMAKLRALRLLWARLGELCGADGVRLSIHAETSARMMTRADPHTNLLRTTIATLAAVTGGADSLTVVPHTAALGCPDRASRTLARNLQLIFAEEAELGRVADPGAGSGAIEALTDALAEKAWSEFQLIEREGGIVESLRSGALPARVEGAREALTAAVASGAAPLVGATIYRETDLGGGAAGAEPEAPPAPGLLAPMRLEDLARRAA